MGTKFILGQEDGTIAGGNARGEAAIDLQMSRTANTQVSSGNYATIGGGIRNQSSNTYSTVSGGIANTSSGTSSVISGGETNTASGARTAICGGSSNTASGNQSFIGGGSSNISGDNYAVVSGGLSNNAASLYSIVSGGQSNTASTNTHATVVGGYSNTSTGQQSLSGGYACNATGIRSIAFGDGSTASGSYAIAIGVSNSNSTYSTALGGRYNRAYSDFCIVLGGIQSQAYLYNQLVSNSNSGTTDWSDNQLSQLSAYRYPTLTTGGTTTLSLDGTGTTNLIIPNGNNRMWKVKVEYVGTITTITGTATGLAVGNSVYGEENFGFKKLAGTSTMGPIMNETQSSDNAIMDTCSLAVTAGASQEMALTFTGPTFAGGGSVTMRVVAKVALVEVAF